MEKQRVFGQLLVELGVDHLEIRIVGEHFCPAGLS